MPSKRGKSIIFFAVLAAVLVIAPVTYVELSGQRLPKISVYYGLRNSVWSGNFTSLNAPYPVMPNASTSTMVLEAGHYSSYLNVSVSGYSLRLYADSWSHITLNLTIFGKLFPNLIASTINISQRGTFPSTSLGDDGQMYLPWLRTINTSAESLGTNPEYGTTPGPIDQPNPSVNLQMNYSARLLNESSAHHGTYFFYLYDIFTFMIGGMLNRGDYSFFSFTVSLTGLSAPVKSQITIVAYNTG